MRELPPTNEASSLEERLIAMLRRLSTVSAWALSDDFQEEERDALAEAIKDANRLLDQATLQINASA